MSTSSWISTTNKNNRLKFLPFFFFPYDEIILVIANIEDILYNSVRVYKMQNSQVIELEALNQREQNKEKKTFYQVSKGEGKIQDK